MYIYPEDIEAIRKIMSAYPDATYRLVENGENGIGTLIKLEVITTLIDRPAIISFEIAGVENW